MVGGNCWTEVVKLTGLRNENIDVLSALKNQLRCTCKTCESGWYRDYSFLFLNRNFILEERYERIIRQRDQKNVSEVF